MDAPPCLSRVSDCPCQYDIILDTTSTSISDRTGQPASTASEQVSDVGQSSHDGRCTHDGSRLRVLLRMLWQTTAADSGFREDLSRASECTVVRVYSTIIPELSVT